MGFNLNTFLILCITGVVLFVAWCGLPLTIFGAVFVIGVIFMLVKLSIFILSWIFRRRITLLTKDHYQENHTANPSWQEGSIYSNTPFEREVSGNKTDAFAMQVDLKNGMLYVRT